MCPGIGPTQPATVEAANRLLQKNHDEHHIFFRDLGGHNHLVHNILTRVALGATAKDLELAYIDDAPVQRPRPPVDEQIVQELATEDGFFEHLGEVQQYTNYMVYFRREIERMGWQQTVNQYCFGRTRNADHILSRMYEQAFHSLIHLGLGVEFQQPIIIAEALAQAATDVDSGVTDFFRNAEHKAEQAGHASKERRLVDLLDDARANDKIRTAPRWDDFILKMKNGVLGRSGKEIAELAAQFRVSPESLERRTAEMLSCAAYFAGASQRAGKARKIDFFYMHNVTSSIFFSTLCRQPWIRMEDKVRLVEWKGRLDVAWYAACGSAELHKKDIEQYQATHSNGWDWNELFQNINSGHDDGHVAKFARALKNGEQAARLFETGEWADSFPVKGDMWLKLAHMAYDTTEGLPNNQKWIMFTGFEQPWEDIPNIS